MIDPESRRPGSPYYAAVLLFAAVLVFAILGLVRSTSVARTASRDRDTTPAPPTPSSTAAVTPGGAAGRPAPTAQIPPPTKNTTAGPPSRTYLYPPSGKDVTPEPAPTTQPRR